LSVGRQNLDLRHLIEQHVQLDSTFFTADFERFWRVLGYKFNRISFFLASGFPLDVVKISGHSSKTALTR